MPSVRISELQSSSALSGSELVHIVQDGVNKNTTISSLSSVVGAPSNTPIFITNIVNNTGLLQKSYVANTVPSNYLISGIVVDTDDSIAVSLEWDGPNDAWNGIPTVNGTPIPVTSMSRIGNTRRFSATITLDLQGADKIIAEVDGGTFEVPVQLLGDGPRITNLTYGPIPTTGGYQPAMFIDGDSVEITVEFDVSDVASVTLYGGASYATASATKNVTVTGTSPPSATFTATVDTSQMTITNLPVKLDAKNSFGTVGDEYTSTSTIPVRRGPDITNVSFGPYPGSQTELKDNDTIQVTFEFDTNNVSTLDFEGGAVYASKNSFRSVTTQDLSATTTMTIDTNVVVPTQQAIRLRAQSSHGGYGSYHVSTDKVTVNNVYPTFNSFNVVYPAGQQAIKNDETADVTLNVANQGSSPTYTYSDPRNEITIPDTTQYTSTKTISGNSTGVYNINQNNYRLTVNRAENDATSTYTNGVVWIADKLPVLSVTHNGGARMRSGGNAGTNAMSYTVTCNSDQRLQTFNMTTNNNTGQFTGTWSSQQNGARWVMNSLQVHDDDDKGTHSWQSVTSTNLSNMSQTAIANGSTYEIGGFVTRTVVVNRLSRYVELETYVTDTSKLIFTHSWPGTWSFDTSLADGTVLDPDINSGTDIELKYTIVNSSAPTVVDRSGDWVFILDRDAVTANNNTISPAQADVTEVI